MAERKIGSKTFRVEPLLATEAIKLQVRLLKVIGPAVDKLPAILRGVGENATEEDKIMSDSAAVAAFMAIFQTADPDEFTKLIGDLAQLATVKRPSGTWDVVDLDSEFSGHLGEMVPVILMVLQEQFGSFFSEALALGGRKVPGKV